MLSIIICSRETNISNILASNIEYTVGIEYEVIVIDNSQNIYSIFEAYNIGISKSKGEILCFVHDDILFHTEDWGKELETIFNNDPQIGLIGVAGSKMKTKMPSAWWDCPEESKVLNIIQHFKEQEKQVWNKGFSFQTCEEEVVVIDGVFMALKRDAGIGFNKNMTGFHNYDLNLAMECNKLNRKMVVTNRILLEHFSIGNQDKNWYQSTIELDQLYGHLLPVFTKINEKKYNLQKQEFENGIAFVYGLLRHNYKKEAIKYWMKMLVIKPYSKFHLNFLKTLIFK